jgi:hypothetical protein
VNTKIVLLGLALLALTPTAASAQEGSNWADKSGVVGIGANVNLGGSAGIHFRTYLSPYFGIMGTFGFLFDHNGATDLFGLDAGIYGMLKVAPFDVGHISLIFGADFLYRNNNNGGGMAVTTEDVGILGAIGIMGEWFATEHFSLFASAGLRAGFVKNEGNGGFPLTANGEGFALDIGAGLWGQAGFTVWFN